MTIPLDRLYHYIENVAKDVYGDVVIYRFTPHGSKKLEDLQCLHDLDWFNLLVTPSIVCNDQEPLDFDYYENCMVKNEFEDLLIKHRCDQPCNLRKPTIFDKTILLHSEKNSMEVQKYLNDKFLPVHYWSHAMISLDWFRYAQHVKQNKKNLKTFLIYNRAWTGTREYRLKFAELLVQLDLKSDCQMNLNTTDPDTGIFYRSFDFKNSAWQPSLNLENYFDQTPAPPHASADFVINDYESTLIEVVLETLFDDSRVHLTEKTLRPIACGQPFIIASGPGSLQYLRDYGFKTYGSVWDEKYDNIENPVDRLHEITRLMKQISLWSHDVKQKKLAEAEAIAGFNKQHFFSQDFFEKVNNELKINLAQQLKQLVDSNTSRLWLDQRKRWSKHEAIKKIITGKQSLTTMNRNNLFDSTCFETSHVKKALVEARKYYNSSTF